MPVHGVLAQDQRRGDLAVREAGRNEPQDLRLPPAERAVRPCRRRALPEEAGQRAPHVALILHPGQVGVAAQGDEARVRQQRGQLAAAADRHGAVAATVQHEGRGVHVWEHRASIGAEVVVERRRGSLRVGRESQIAAERGDLDAARVRVEEPREHLRRERPVDADEVDDGAAGGVRDVVPGGIATEEDDLAHPSGMGAREARRSEARTGAGEERGRLRATGIEDGPDLVHVGHRRVEAPVGEADADAVEADDPMARRELLHEAPQARLGPVFLEMRDPPASEQEQGAFACRGIRDPPAAGFAVADLLLHGPTV